ncbi:MAG: nucleotide exchange factor GrpE [Anaerolineales bacterium]
MAKKRKVDIKSASQEEEKQEGNLAEEDARQGQAADVEILDEEEEPAAGEIPAELTAEEIEELKASLDESEEKAREYLDGWQRSRAEFANYKKRIMREREQMYEKAKGDVIKQYLDISDDLGRALQDRPASGEGAQWAEGIELIYKKLQLLLEKEGVEPMEAEGEMFDPTRHEAVFKEENDRYESGEIIEVLQEGYVMGDRILRPALVRVAA